MKKATYLSAALLAAIAVVPQFGYAEENLPASTSTIVWDHTPWENEQVLKLFSTAWDQGRNYPTKAELEAIGLTIDLEFVRSHTRFRPIVKDASRDIVKDINHDRNLWCNLPAGYGKNTGGYPSTQFDQDVFSMWNYTNLFGAWNYGFLEAPGAWVDAAHKNGTHMYGGIKFFESWNNDGSEGAYQKFIQTKNDDGTYKYSRAFVNAATFFGNDGYNYNSEGTIFSTKDFYGFHADVARIARELGLSGFGIGQYTQSAALSDNNAVYLIGTQDAKTYDCMLNYSGNKLAHRSAASSYETANKLGLGEHVYQGQLLVNLAGDYWTEMNTEATKKMNIVIWGEHDQSRFFQFRTGDDPIGVQENYQMLMEKAFSGAFRNPLKRPGITNSWGKFQTTDPNAQLTESPGFASMFPERTAINYDLPFETHFNLGNGENYFYKGKISHGSWYNMSQQDIVPTYRWLVSKLDDMNTYANDIDVRFTHEDAYVGGSSLKLTGASNQGNDIVLYRTNLNVTGDEPKVTIAAKGAKGASNLAVIVKKAGSDAWIAVPFGDFASNAWEEKTLDLSGIATNDVIELIGLRVLGGTAESYRTFVGKLRLHDGRRIQMAKVDPESLMVEIKEETQKSLSVKMAWEPDYTGYTTSVNDFGMVFNDEINVDHFEILFKEGENGKVKEVGRTAQWATYIGNIPLAQDADAYIGVRSVSVDLISCSPISWVRIPRYTGTLPEVKEENPYGDSWMSSIGSGNTLEQIINNIYVEKVTTTGATQDLNYVVTANPLLGNSEEQYYYAKDHKLVVNQGQKIKLLVKGFNSGTNASLKYDFLNAYLDFDGNYSFLDADEVLGKFGNQNSGTDAICNPGIEIEVTIPSDAHIGESRLRIVGSDAWTPHPGPVGGTVKGYSIEFPVEIQGTNPDRGPAETYKDRRDQGEVEEPEFLEGNDVPVPDSIEGVVNDFSGVAVENGTIRFTNCEKAWIFDVNGRMVKFVANAEGVVSTADIVPGVYIVKMLNNQVVRSTKIVVK